MAGAVKSQLEHFHSLGLKVVNQARRRVFNGEKVPNEEKIFSIFEPHTELLKRGKASKPIEFGHMVLIQQAEGKFITDYRVFEKKPVDHTLVDPVISSHERTFGEKPEEVSADKGFYEKLGYKSFGELPNYPPPFSRFFFKKTLAVAAAGAA